jgi:hypothetical protein
MTGLFLLIVAGLVAISWWQLLKGKEYARRAASRSCKEHGLALMDDTVMLDSVQLQPRGDGQVYGLKYRFEFAQDGILRKGGSVLIVPGHPARVVIRTRDGQLIEEI